MERGLRSADVPLRRSKPAPSFKRWGFFAFESTCLRMFNTAQEPSAFIEASQKTD
jgi:hypothetical protein